MNPSYTGSILDKGMVTITGAFLNSSDPHSDRYYTLTVCFRGQCSAPDVRNLVGKDFAHGPIKIR
jgi:hypothetical protein